MKFRGSFRFRGKCFLQYVSGWLLCCLFGSFFSCLGAQQDEARTFLMLPFYILMAGIAMAVIMVANFYGIYFPLLISVNVTRRNCVQGFMGCAAGLSLVVTKVGDFFRWSNLCISGRIAGMGHRQEGLVLAVYRGPEQPFFGNRVGGNRGFYLASGFITGYFLRKYEVRR